MATNNVPRHYAARRGSSTREDCLGKLPVCGLCAAILTACVVPGESGATPTDLRRAWSDITSRLARTPAYIAAARRLVTMPCHLFGVVGSKQLAGAPDFLQGALTDAARNQLGARSKAHGSFLKARDAALTAIAELRHYIDEHAASWPVAQYP